MKRNIFITIISVLIIACLLVYARTTTTDLNLVKPAWDEEVDILTDINANSDILEAFANDVLEFDLSPVLRADLDISTFNIEGVDATEFGYLDGVTSDVQTQLSAKIEATLTEEEVEDYAGGMFTGNTETGITLTYQDADGTIDAVIGANDIVESMLKFVDSPADEDVFTYESTTGDFEWHTKAELGIGLATSITDDLILKAAFADEDWGDMTVATNVVTIDSGAVTYAKIQNVSATDKVLGRVTAGAGVVEEIVCTSAGRALIDDTDASAQRTTLGLVIGTDVEVDLSNEAGLYAVLSDVALFLEDLIDDTTPELGGELDAGAHTIGFTLQTATGDGTDNIDWRLGNKMKLTLPASAETLTFTAPSNPCHLTLHIVQDGVGGRDVTFPAAVKWLGTEPTWSDGGASKTIIMSMWYDGTNYWSQGTPWES